MNEVASQSEEQQPMASLDGPELHLASAVLLIA